MAAECDYDTSTRGDSSEYTITLGHHQIGRGRNGEEAWMDAVKTINGLYDRIQELEAAVVLLTRG